MQENAKFYSKYNTLYFRFIMENIKVNLYHMKSALESPTNFSLILNTA